MLIDQPLILAITISLVVMVMLCSITDISEHRIPNRVLLPALLLAFLFNGLLSGWPGLLDCLLGLTLGLAVLFPFYFAGGISAGDVKLLGVVGAFLGVNGALIAGVATLGFAGVLGVLIIVWRVLEPILATHVAPSVRANGPLTSLPVRTSIRDLARNTEFPYAPAIACGTCFALWQLGYFSPVAL